MITLVAFNVKQVKSVYYKKVKNSQTAAKWLEKMLDDSQVDFVSIRKIRS